MEKTHTVPDIQILVDSALSNQKQGRPFIVIFNASSDSLRAHKLYESLSQKTRTVLVRLPDITHTNWQNLTDGITELLGKLSIRQASFVSFGSVGAIAQNLALCVPKVVRALALVDASTRPNPGLVLRILDKLEHWLPMGLPFRSDSSGFDSRSFAQRIRAPVLVISTDGSSLFHRSQAALLNRSLPTSWFFELDGENSEERLRELVLDFEEVPAKRPQ